MAILDNKTLDFISNSTAQSERLGVRLGELLQPGDLLCLSGDLGAGKTTLARGIGRGWGTAVRVTSPTFMLINQYPRAKDGRVLHHVDAYRLENVGDVATVGLEDIFDGVEVAIIEWPERIANLLPEDTLWIEMDYVNDSKRRLRIRARGNRSEKLFNDFKKRAFGV
mgnify:CR=1 FL=1